MIQNFGRERQIFKRRSRLNSGFFNGQKSILRAILCQSLQLQAGDI